MMNSKTFYILFAIFLVASPCAAAHLRPEADRAFAAYAATVEARLQQQHRSAESFVQFSTAQTEALERLRKGEFVIEQLGNDLPETPGAMMHHWRGSAFVPGAKAADFLRLMQDYDKLYESYKPQMVSSRLISRQGSDFQVAMRLRQHKVITVVMDSEYDVHYGALDSAHGYSISRSTRVSEIADAGTKDEHAIAPGKDNGFLWRINTYWTYAEVNGGLVIQCESISITRDIPRGLGWMIGPFVQSVPRDSLEFTLKATSNALAAQAANRNAMRSSR
jgi:hypothetical protein